jgi:hypothetical protein
MADTYEFAEANAADKATAHEYAFDDEHVDMHEADIARLLAGARKAERAAVLAELQAPTWTRDKPTEPGAYWLRSEWLTRADGQIVEVDDATGELGFHVGSMHFYVSGVDGEWAGPLTPPR